MIFSPEVSYAARDRAVKRPSSPGVGLHPVHRATALRADDCRSLCIFGAHTLGRTELLPSSPEPSRLESLPALWTGAFSTRSSFVGSFGQRRPLALLTAIETSAYPTSALWC